MQRLQPTEAASTSSGSVLTLRLPNALAAVETARLAMHRYLDPLCLPSRLIYRLELVLEESVMNRVWHAHPEGGQHWFDFELQILPAAIQMRFIDDGRPFDPLSRPEPPRPQSLDEARPGGLGLLLTRKSVSSAVYERTADQNVLTLSFDRTA